MKKRIDKKKANKKSSTSQNFVSALSVVSIIGFVSIVLESLFYVSISNYIETFWLIALGMGLVLETSVKEIKKIERRGLTPENLGKITMVIVGSMAIIAGILSLPQINVQNASFLAVKGIVGILAIIFIILQTWVIKRGS